MIKSHLKRVIKAIDKLSPYPIYYPFIMSKAEIAIFDDAVRNSQNYLEFGLGGSSLRALLKSRAKVYTVESSRDWLNYMRKYLILRYFEDSRLHVYLIDIGPTTDWGFPASTNPKNIFEAYSSEIFKSIDSKSIDLALVDGRFRVACILKIILECYQNENLRILVHDFWNRDHYHVVLKYLDTVNKADTIGLFSIKNDIDLNSVESDYQSYKLNPQ